jgi:hypothetical protein
MIGASTTMGRTDRAAPPVTSAPLIETVNEDDDDDMPDVPLHAVHHDATTMFPSVTDAAPDPPPPAEQCPCCAPPAAAAPSFSSTSLAGEKLLFCQLLGYQADVPLEDLHSFAADVPTWSSASMPSVCGHCSDFTSSPNSPEDSLHRRVPE